MSSFLDHHNECDHNPVFKQTHLQSLEFFSVNIKFMETVQ